MTLSSLPAQTCLGFTAAWLTAWLCVLVANRRAKRREDEAWVEALLERYHADFAKRFRNGQWKPKDKYGKFSVNDKN
jgi:hypothetical protein